MASMGGVLRVTVSHMSWSLSDEVLLQVFGPYGGHKVLVLERTSSMVAYIFFHPSHDAAEAQRALHGCCIYDNCCWMDVQMVSRPSTSSSGVQATKTATPGVPTPSPAASPTLTAPSASSTTMAPTRIFLRPPTPSFLGATKKIKKRAPRERRALFAADRRAGFRGYLPVDPVAAPAALSTGGGHYVKPPALSGGADARILQERLRLGHHRRLPPLRLPRRACRRAPRPIRRSFRRGPLRLRVQGLGQLHQPRRRAPCHRHHRPRRRRHHLPRLRAHHHHHLFRGGLPQGTTGRHPRRRRWVLRVRAAGLRSHAGFTRGRRDARVCSSQTPASSATSLSTSATTCTAAPASPTPPPPRDVPSMLMVAVSSRPGALSIHAAKVFVGMWSLQEEQSVLSNNMSIPAMSVHDAVWCFLVIASRQCEIPLPPRTSIFISAVYLSVQFWGVKMLTKQLQRSIPFPSPLECDQTEWSIGLFVYRDALFLWVSGKCLVAVRGHDLLPQPKPPDRSGGNIPNFELLLATGFALWDPGASTLQLLCSDCQNSLVSPERGISLQSMGGFRVDKPRNSTLVQSTQCMDDIGWAVMHWKFSNGQPYSEKLPLWDKFDFSPGDVRVLCNAKWWQYKRISRQQGPEFLLNMTCHSILVLLEMFWDPVLVPTFTFKLFCKEANLQFNQLEVVKQLMMPEGAAVVQWYFGAACSSRVDTSCSKLPFGASWSVQLLGVKLQAYGNAKLVISRRVKEFHLLESECCITMLEHLISISPDVMENSSVILPRWSIELAALCECRKEMEMLLPVTSPIPKFPNVGNCKCKRILIFGLQIFSGPMDQCDMHVHSAHVANRKVLVSKEVHKCNNLLMNILLLVRLLCDRKLARHYRKQYILSFEHIIGIIPWQTDEEANTGMPIVSCQAAAHMLLGYHLLHSSHRSFGWMGKNTISERIQITICSAVTFGQMVKSGQSCTDLMAYMEEMQWKPPWLRMQLLLSLMVLLQLCSHFSSNQFNSAEKSQAPWDPGGFESGLRASRILSGGECQGLGRWIMGCQLGHDMGFQVLPLGHGKGIKDLKARRDNYRTRTKTSHLPPLSRSSEPVLAAYLQLPAISSLDSL